MSKLQILKVAALAGVCALQAIVGARAQDNGGFDVSDVTPATSVAAPLPSLGQFTFGLDGVTDSSAVFGRYNGMPESGIGVLAGWEVGKRDAWDSGTTRYYDFSGYDVNVGNGGGIAPEATINLSLGDQGTWEAFATYDAMTYTASDRFTTILDKEGNLSPGFLTAIGNAGAFLDNSPFSTSYYGPYSLYNGVMAALGDHVPDYGPDNELTYKIGTRRDKGTVGASYFLDSWQLSAAVSHEHKEGTLEQTMATGMGDDAMVTFPMPVDYDTDTYTVVAAYTDDRLQANISYRFSDFIDHKSGGYGFEGWNFISIQDPVTLTYTSYEKSGVYSLPPSNQAHTITAKLGYNLSPTTRLTETVSFGLQLQNDPFVAATRVGFVLADPMMSAQLAANPRSLNGLVETGFVNLALTTQPLAGLNIRTSYTFDARDPQTKAMWIYGNPMDDIMLAYREAAPESWIKQKVDLTADYRIDASARLSLAYAFRDDQRTNAITHHAVDNQESAKFFYTFTPVWTGTLGYTHADRTASAPDFSLWLFQIPSECGGPTLDSLGCQQVPYYEAARTQDAATGMLTGTIDGNATFSLFARFTNNQYHDPNAIYNGAVNPSVGVYRDYNLQAGPDLTYRADDDTEVHVFYTFLRTYRAMRGLNDQSNPSGGNYYNVMSTYDIHTAGIGGKWRANDKLKFSADYVFSYGSQAFAQSGTWDIDQAGQAFGGDPLISTRSAVHQFRVTAIYDYSQSTSFSLGYRFDSLDATDWALVGRSVGQVLTGDVPPKYNVSTIMAAVTVKM